MEFFDWGTLETFGGATLAVCLITQATKGAPGISKIPTQLWSYILAVVVLIASTIFAGDVSIARIALTLINGFVVSIAANKGYETVADIKASISDKGGNVDGE